MADAIDQLIDDVLVDAYGDDEQLAAFRQAFEDATTFPFVAQVVGVYVQVTDIDYPGDERRGLVAVCERAGARHTIALLDIVPGPAIPRCSLPDRRPPSMGR